MNPPLDPMPEDVNPTIYTTGSELIMEYPATSGTTDQENVIIAIDGATAENYAHFDVPGKVTTAAAYIEDLDAYGWQIALDHGVNQLALTYNGRPVWRFSLEYTPIN